MVATLSTKNYWISQTKLPFYDQSCHRVAKLSKYEEYTQRFFHAIVAFLEKGA
jgi:hypothetical protein